MVRSISDTPLLNVDKDRNFYLVKNTKRNLALRCMQLPYHNPRIHNNKYKVFLYFNLIQGINNCYPQFKNFVFNTLKVDK